MTTGAGRTARTGRTYAGGAARRRERYVREDVREKRGIRYAAAVRRACPGARGLVRPRASGSRCGRNAVRCSRSLMAVRTRVRGTGDAQRALMTEQARSAEPAAAVAASATAAERLPPSARRISVRKRTRSPAGRSSRAKARRRGWRPSRCAPPVPPRTPHAYRSSVPFMRTVRRSAQRSLKLLEAHGTPFVIHDDRMRPGRLGSRRGARPRPRPDHRPAPRRRAAGPRRGARRR